MASFSAETSLGFCGGWLSAHPLVEHRFFEELLALIHTPYNEGSSHTLPVAKFQRAIEADPELVDLFDQMFLQVSPENKVRYQSYMACFS
jgi:phosphatidylserine decarboxylase